MLQYERGFILAGVVDFQTSDADNEALIGMYLIVKNSKQLSKEQIEEVIKVGRGI